MDFSRSSTRYGDFPQCFMMPITSTTTFQIRVAFVSTLLLLLLGVGGCRDRPAREVVVYASQDKNFADPILKEFAKSTGIYLRVLYDSEAVKTVGLASRLKAEGQYPRCDVFWNNEMFRTKLLQKEGILQDGTNSATFGYRQRVLAFNPTVIEPRNVPENLVDLTNTSWRGRVAMAYPLFGTTSTHMLALRQKWGAEAWEAWARAMVANGVRLVDGNSVAAKLAHAGEVLLALTDSDDVLFFQRQGLKLASKPLDRDGLLIPNTVSIVKGAPHPEYAHQLLEYLRSDVTVKQLESAGAFEAMPTRSDSSNTLETLNWGEMMDSQEKAIELMKKIFLR